MAGNSGGVDVLFEVRNAFFLGNFQFCITEAQKIKPPSAAVAIERDVLMYRSYIAQRQYRVVVEEVNTSSPAELQAVQRMAMFLQSPNQREDILAGVDKEITKGVLTSGVDVNDTFLLMAASMYLHQQQYDPALRVLNQSDSLEGAALRIQILLTMQRVDLAKKELKLLQEKDDDCTLTQLSLAWFNMAVGGDKYQDAFYIFQEMAEKTVSTSLLLNGQASCYMLQNKFEEAEALLLDALAKDSGNPETLVNLIAVSQHLGKPPEVSNRYLAQLRESCEDHPFIRDLTCKEDLFSKCAGQYSPSVAA